MSAPSDPDFQSNQKLFYILAKFSPVGIFQTNLDGNCIYVNHRWCEITGLAPEQAYEQGWIVALHPEDRARVHDDWYRAAKANTRFQSKYRFQKPDGTITWVLGQAVRHEGADLDSPGYIGTITDITEVTKSEHDLGAAKEQYQLLFERNPLPGWVFDIETLAFVEVNQAAVNHYGYSRQEFLQMTLKDIRLPAELPRLENSLKVMPPGLKRAGVWTHRKKDGKLIEAEVFNYGVMFGGKPARLVLVNDVTERKHYEEGLKEIGRLAALKQTAAVFAHEVANPLNGISAILHLLREQSMQDAQGRGLLQDAINEINRLGSLLNDFRTYARPEDIQREIVDLRVLPRDAVDGNAGLPSTQNYQQTRICP
ncbi:MAG: PAS domain S-box protein [Deltaproteobacteria bacterium]|nr:PAS domain S-box protein [Deltaproteobacteria bacterium]